MRFVPSKEHSKDKGVKNEQEKIRGKPIRRQLRLVISAWYRGETSDVMIFYYMEKNHGSEHMNTNTCQLSIPL